MKSSSTFANPRSTERRVTRKRFFTQGRRLSAIVAVGAAILLAGCRAGIPTAGSGSGPSTSKLAPIRYFIVSAGGSMTVSDFYSVRQAIESVAPQWDTSARLGLTIYGGAACGKTTDVSPALDNSSAVATALDGTTPQGWSTATEGVNAATAQLVNSGLDLTGSKIIYILNGTALSCSGGSEEASTVAAVQNAYSHGISVSIIAAYGFGSFLQFFQELANAGAGLPPTGTQNAPYDNTTDGQTLVSDIEALGP